MNPNYQNVDLPNLNINDEIAKICNKLTEEANGKISSYTVLFGDLTKEVDSLTKKLETKTIQFTNIKKQSIKLKHSIKYNEKDIAHEILISNEQRLKDLNEEIEERQNLEKNLDEEIEERNRKLNDRKKVINDLAGKFNESINEYNDRLKIKTEKEIYLNEKIELIERMNEKIIEIDVGIVNLKEDIIDYEKKCRKQIEKLKGETEDNGKRLAILIKKYAYEKNIMDEAIFNESEKRSNLSNVKDTIQQLTRQIESCRLQKTNLSTSFDHLIEEVATSNKLYEIKMKEFNDYKKKTTERMNYLKRTIVENKKEIELVKKKVEKDRMKENKLTQQLKSLEQTQNKSTGERDRQTKKFQQLKDELMKVTEENVELSKRIRSTNQEIIENKQKHSISMSGKKNELKMITTKLNEIKTRRENLQKKIINLQEKNGDFKSDSERRYGEKAKKLLELKDDYTQIRQDWNEEDQSKRDYEKSIKIFRKFYDESQNNLHSYHKNYEKIDRIFDQLLSQQYRLFTIFKIPVTVQQAKSVKITSINLEIIKERENLGGILQVSEKKLAERNRKIDENENSIKNFQYEIDRCQHMTKLTNESFQKLSCDNNERLRKMENEMSLNETKIFQILKMNTLIHQNIPKLEEYMNKWTNKLRVKDE
ncbi:hypothetical protein SNEBB_011409 [Seison nebaliae]|nr:hypothetical protein SNEBB_011409 [Seison nebaliae]